MEKVYFDNAATTPIHEEVVSYMTEVLKQEYGNPSSTHAYGRSAKSIIETARKEIASRLNAQPTEIIFTSGGTEAVNFILKGCVQGLAVKRIISSKIEHHAVLHSLDALEAEFGTKVDYVKVDEKGRVDLKHLEELLKQSKEKTLVSLMHVNNEVGTLLDIHAVGDLCAKYNALFHSDTVQSIGHFPMDFSQNKIHFATAAAHKFHGPKGVGFAFIRKGSGLEPLIHGGAQERGMRAGTEPVYAIAGMHRAITMAYDNLEESSAYIQKLKNYFITTLKREIPGVLFNGACTDKDNSTYTLINFSLPISKKKALLMLFQLDLKGIACSQGSACQSGGSSGSHVLRAILGEEVGSRSALRFSFSTYNTLAEVDYAVSVLKEFAVSQVKQEA
ncbi:MAG TPA: cysteine desulfurase family protein [Flavobacteriaceae bacterium]|nr:cysteine desulfurase family protein [Flavobacteriaceae bacterium]